MRTKLPYIIATLLVWTCCYFVPQFVFRKYNQWRREVFFEGYLRGATHADIYRYQTGSIAPMAWLSNAQYYVNTEPDWPIKVVPGGPWDKDRRNRGTFTNEAGYVFTTNHDGYVHMSPFPVR